MESNTTMNFYPVLFEGSLQLDASYIGISNWYRWNQTAINSDYKNPDNENSSPATYSLNRYCTINQEYGGPSKWTWIEGLKGQYDYTQLITDDNWVRYWTQTMGKRVLTEIAYTPGWANHNTTSPLGITGRLSSTKHTCSAGYKIFKIVDTGQIEFEQNASFKKRYYVYSQSNPTAKMSGKGYRYSSNGVSDLTITPGTGAVASNGTDTGTAAWTTTGGSGSAAQGTLTIVSGVVTDFTITVPAYSYTIASPSTIVPTAPASLGSNTVTIVPGITMALTIDMVEGSGTYTDWFIKYNGGNLAPTNMADFADWCEWLFARNERPFTTAGAVDCGWGGSNGYGVRDWFIRNEPQFQGSSNGASQYFRDTPQKLAEMHRIAYCIAKKHNPLNNIVGGENAYISDSNILVQYTTVSHTINSLTFGLTMKNNLNGWFVNGSNIKFGTTVLSGQGTTTLTLSKDMNGPAAGIYYFSPPNGLSVNAELFNVSSEGLDLTPWGITNNPTGVGTVCKDWIDIVSTHSYVGYREEKDNSELQFTLWYQWRKLRKLMVDLGMQNKPLWQTETMLAPLSNPYQYADHLLFAKRSFLISVFGGGCRHWIYFNWGGGNNPFCSKYPIGVIARADWYNFFTGLFASPVTLVTMDYITKKITVTQANGTVTVV